MTVDSEVAEIRPYIAFAKIDNVDYLLLTNDKKIETNYNIKEIDPAIGKTVFERNKFYKWHPEALNQKDYDYIIYHDIRIDITNVMNLIYEMKNSDHGINLSIHRVSDSIERELKELSNLKRSNISKEYIDSIKKKVGEKNLKTKSIMPEATVIVYEMKKLNNELKNEIYNEFKNFGSIRDQPAIANVCFNKGIKISSICTLNGIVPLGKYKNSKFANKNLKEIPSNYIVLKK